MIVERVTLNRNNETPADPGFDVDIQGDVFAIAIGAESDVDRCHVVPSTHLAGAQSPNILADTVGRQFLLGPGARAVSVRRPHIGLIRGPYRVFYPYARQIYRSGGIDHRGTVLADGAGLYGYAPSGSDDVDLVTPKLELEFYRCMPPWLPSERAPLEHAFYYNDFGTSGGYAGGTIRIPGFGRKTLSLSIGMSGRSAGTLRWTFRGINVVGIGGGLGVYRPEIVHNLQAATDETADFEETYFFDGEFDYYELILTEQAALNADVVVDGIIKAWD